MQIVNGLRFNNIRGDIYGGVTAAVVALPLALAFGVSSGAGPIAGIYGAIFVGLFAALFGGTPAQVSGPTGPMTVVMALVFTHYTSMFPDDPAQGAALAFTVVIMGGLMQILFGFFRIGKFIELVPHPVVSGFMSGIGVIIILLQVGPLLGYDPASSPIAAAAALPDFVLKPQEVPALLGLLTLVIVFGLPSFFPKVNKLIPAPLAALIVGTLVLYFFADGSMSSAVVAGKTEYLLADARVLGAIPTGLPDPQMPVFELSLLPDMLQSALTLAALGAIDSLLTSLVADNITRTQHKSDRELIGQGIGNTIAGFFGGLPGAGATMRTVVNVKAGGQTPISGALHALILLAIVLGAGGLASFIPYAVLAGILIKVGVDIIDWDYLRRLHTAPKAGVAMMFTVLLITVFVDLILAVAVGMAMASAVFMKRMVDLQLESIQVFDGSAEESPLAEEESAILDGAAGRILLYHLGGPMSFGAAKGMVRRLAAFDQYDALVLDLTDVPQIDFTATRALDDMVYGAQSSGREVFLAGCRKQVCDMLEKQGVFTRLREGHSHKARFEALRHAAQTLGVG